MIDGAPDTTLTICTDEAAQIGSVVLMRPGAVTHGFDVDQRYLPLSFESYSNPARVIAVAPPDSHYAPPGDYLLFILTEDKAPAIAKWVRVQRKPQDDLCDQVRPALIADLCGEKWENFDGVTFYWTAPGDDSTFAPTGAAREYELRYSGSHITYSTWANDTLAAGPATPSAPGTQETHWIEGLTPGVRYYFRLISKDDHGNVSGLSNELNLLMAEPYTDCGASFAGGGGGGGGGGSLLERNGELASLQVAEGLGGTDAATEVENSLFEGAAAGERVSDLLALPGLLEDGGVYRAWVRTIGRQEGVVDRAALLAVDHDPATQAFVAGGQVVLGGAVSAIAASLDDGTDVTGAVTGSTTPLLASSNHAVALELPAGSGPLVLEAARQGGPGTGSIRVLIPDGPGWRPVGEVFARRDFAKMAVDVEGAVRVRLEFEAEVRVRYAGRLILAEETPALGWATLQSADHDGQTAGTLDGTDSLSVSLAGIDTLQLSFAAPPLAAGKVRDCFLRVEATLPGTSHSTTTGRTAPARDALPTQFALYPARPNPFSQEVAFRFALPVGLVATLEVFDIQGRRVQTPHDGYLPPGYHTVRWDGRGESGARVAAGTYFYRLAAGSFVARRKVTLAK